MCPQPTQPLEDKNKGTPIKDQLLAAVNDEYLEAKCYRVISKLDTSQECLIAIGWWIPILPDPYER